MGPRRMKRATLIQRVGRDLYQAGVHARIRLARMVNRLEPRDDGEDWWRSASPREMPAVTRADWTPAGARLAAREADNGQLRLPAQLCQAIRGYGCAHGVLSTRTHGMFKLPIKFAGDPELRSALRGSRSSYAANDDLREDGEVVEGDFWRMCPESELARLVSWGILLGVGVGELVPPEEQEPPRRRALGERYVPTLRTWESEWLRYDWSRRKWFLTTDRGEIEVTPGDGRWVLYLPYGASHPWLHGAWRACGLAYVLATIALYDRARHSEVLGSAARVGMAPKGATERQRERLREQIKSMSRDNVFVMPEGWELRMVEAVGRTWDIYNDTIKWAEREIEISLAGQVVTTEGNSGIGESDIWSDIKGDFIQFTAESLATTLHDQVIAPWAEINYGDRALAPWARWNLQRPKDRKTLAEAAAAEAQAIASLADAITKGNAALVQAGSDQRVNAEGMFARYDVLMCVANIGARMGELDALDALPDGPVWHVGWRPIARAVEARRARKRRSRPEQRDVQGIPVVIDRPKGYVDQGVDEAGQPWTRVYQVDYGYIPGTEGGDGEPLDVFVGPASSDAVFWAEQVNAAGDFDELKLFIGFESELAARACYLAHIPGRYLKAFTVGTLAQVQAMCGVEVAA